MTPNQQVERLGKCRFLLFDKATGAVIDFGSGGGAGESLTGDAFIIWRMNDPTAPDRVGCLPYFFSPVGNPKPESVNLATVDACITDCRAWCDAHHLGDTAAADDCFAKMCLSRDETLTYRPVPELES